MQGIGDRATQSEVRDRTEFTEVAGALGVTTAAIIVVKAGPEGKLSVLYRDGAEGFTVSMQRNETGVLERSGEREAVPDITARIQQLVEPGGMP